MNQQTQTDWYAKRLNILKSRRQASEADVCDQLVRPILTRVLHFDEEEIFAQKAGSKLSLGGGRPDFVCIPDGIKRCNVIVEVKKLGTNLEKRTGTNWSSSPQDQLHTYLNRHENATRGSWGILTNGEDWHVVRKDAEFLSPGVFTEPLGERRFAGTISEVEKLLAPVLSLDQAIPESRTSDRSWLQEIQDSTSPRTLLNKLVGQANVTNTPHDRLAWRDIGSYGAPGQLLTRKVAFACAQFNYPDGMIAPGDIREELIQHLEPDVGRVVGVAFSDSHPELERQCRAFLITEGEIFVTAQVDPCLPGPRVARQFEILAKNYSTESVDSVIDAFLITPLRREFHEEIQKWFGRFTLQGSNDLRHLIRIMFTWLLQSRGVLPDDTLWLPSAQARRHNEVQNHIEWVFGSVLGTEFENRLQSYELHPWQVDLLNTLPFLNGSMFRQLKESERPEPIDNDAYLNDEFGLFRILSSYDWTLRESNGYESESAIDPSMLGDMFEILMLHSDGVRIEKGFGGAEHRKMPGGTYYTPSDLADEMATDAIGAWLSSRLADLDFNVTRDLVHPIRGIDTVQNLGEDQLVAIQDATKELTVLDPCCGSGAFTVAALHAIWRVRTRIEELKTRLRAIEREPYAQGTDLIEEIIENQLHAVDIHPMAVLITRLRLMISVIDLRTKEHKKEIDIRPLPNLETRCVAANTLETNVSGKGDSYYELGDIELQRSLRDLAAARQMYTSAHTSEEKANALQMESEARDSLRTSFVIQGYGDDFPWLEDDLLGFEASPIQADIRDVLPAPMSQHGERGWDIVLGNPPYQRPDSTDASRVIELGYIGTDNLYLLFLEAALVQLRPKGCLTMVVPNSIAFGNTKKHKGLRVKLESRFSRVDIRTYDNRPNTMFPKLPWLKGKDGSNENAQRVTVVIGSGTGTSTPAEIYSEGLIRIVNSQRNSIMQRSRSGVQQPRHIPQWTQAATLELRDLLEKMWIPPPPEKCPV